MTPKVVTALSKVNGLDFGSNIKEDSLSIFDERLGERFFGMSFKKLYLLSTAFLCFTQLACSG